MDKHSSNKVFDGVIQIVDKIKNRSNGENKIFNVVKSQAIAGEMVQAKQTAQTISDESYRLEALGYISEVQDILDDLERINEELDDVENILLTKKQTNNSNYDSISSARIALANAHAEVGNIKRSKINLEKAKEIAEKISDDTIRSVCLKDIHSNTSLIKNQYLIFKYVSMVMAIIALANTQAEVGDIKKSKTNLQKANEIVEKMHDDEMCLLCLESIVDTQIEIGDIKQALQTAQTISDDKMRLEILSNIAKMQAETGNFENCLIAIEKISDYDCYSITILEIFSELNFIDLDPSNADIQILNKIVEKISDDEVRSTLLENIVNIQIKIGDTEQALQTAQTISDDSHRLDALFSVANAEAEFGDLERAQEILNNIENILQTRKKIKLNYFHVATTIIAVASAQAETGNNEYSKANLELAKKFTNKITDTNQFSICMESIALNQIQIGNVEQTLNTAQKISDETVRSRIVNFIERKKTS